MMSDCAPDCDHVDCDALVAETAAELGIAQPDSSSEGFAAGGIGAGVIVKLITEMIKKMGPQIANTLLLQLMAAIEKWLNPTPPAPPTT